MEPLSRIDTLSVLSSMGIELPATTKLPDEALEKRLEQALYAAQSLAKVIPKVPLHIASVPSWPSCTSGVDETRSVHDAIRRGNFGEAVACMRARSVGAENAVDLYVNPILDLRQTLMCIAKLWDDGYRCCVVKDPEGQTFAINIRMLSVQRIDSKTPLLVMLYQSFAQNNRSPGLQWVQERMQESDAGTISLIHANELEGKLLLQLLAMNAKHLPPDFQPHRHAVERDFKVSFLIPVGPLSFEDLGKFNADTGCVLCGEKTTSRCSQCLSVLYCGQACQRAHWAEHKPTCRSLRGGTWRTVRFVNSMPGFEGHYSYIFNRFNFNNKYTGLRTNHERYPPPNAHGAKAFLVKLQIGLANRDAYMIYDRQRTLESFFRQDRDLVLFAEIRREMDGPRGGHAGFKMYRWAKRVSDWELSICLDKEPQADVKW
ncbi:hypothetical protein BKA93DRAFT_732547 [Sparassis latifolia]